MKKDKPKSNADNGYALRRIFGILDEGEYMAAKKRIDEIEREFEGFAK
ncbi:hypothetical protein [Thermococcus sp. M36]|nr:hypothetical protein [Thermococcus sp. M36]